jgi:hypothetical protein
MSIFDMGLFENGEVGVGVFPELEEGFVFVAGGGGVGLLLEGSGEVEVGESLGEETDFEGPWSEGILSPRRINDLRPVWSSKSSKRYKVPSSEDISVLISVEIN